MWMQHVHKHSGLGAHFRQLQGTLVLPRRSAWTWSPCMPSQDMRVDFPTGTSLSHSLSAPGAFSPLLRDGANNLVGQVVLRPVESPRLRIVLGGLALVGLTVAAVALASEHSKSERRQLERQLVEARGRAADAAPLKLVIAAPAGWYFDGVEHHRWWDGQQWTEHVQPQPSRTPPPAGWYGDGAGRERWWDGHDWTDHFLNASGRTVPASSDVASWSPGHPIEASATAVGMSSAEWRDRFRAMVLASAFSDEQWRLLSRARIEDADEALLAWQHELSNLTLHEFSDRVRRAFVESPTRSTEFEMVGPGWYDDQAGHQRWWDGHHWTQHVQTPVSLTVAARGVHGLPPAGWYDDNAGRWRWWNGKHWTGHYG